MEDKTCISCNDKKNHDEFRPGRNQCREGDNSKRRSAKKCVNCSEMISPKLLIEDLICKKCIYHFETVFQKRDKTQVILLF